MLALTPLVVPWRRGLLPAFDRRVVASLLREALPLAVALTMNVIYFRVLMIMTSLLASQTQTGYFATSFQVFAVLFSLPLLVLSSALPLLSVAGRDDSERLRFGLQRMTEVSLAVSVVFVLAIYALAPTLIPLLGGAQYAGAAPVLQIQSFALIAVFVGQVWQLGLLSLRRQAALAWANAGALALVLVLGAVLIPLWGARGSRRRGCPRRELPCCTRLPLPPARRSGGRAAGGPDAARRARRSARVRDRRSAGDVDHRPCPRRWSSSSPSPLRCAPFRPSLNHALRRR